MKLYPPIINGESFNQHNLFKKYINLGKNRSLKILSKNCHIPQNDLKVLSIKFSWNSRIEAFYNKSQKSKGNEMEKVNNLIENEISKKDKSNIDKSRIDLLNKMQETLNKYSELINEFDESYITKEDDYETRLVKTSKVIRVFEQFIRVTIRIDKEIEKLKNTDPNSEENRS